MANDNKTRIKFIEIGIEGKPTVLHAAAAAATLNSYVFALRWLSTKRYSILKANALNNPREQRSHSHSKFHMQSHINQTHATADALSISNDHYCTSIQFPFARIVLYQFFKKKTLIGNNILHTPSSQGFTHTVSSAQPTNDDAPHAECWLVLNAFCTLFFQAIPIQTGISSFELLILCCFYNASTSTAFSRSILTRSTFWFFFPLLVSPFFSLVYFHFFFCTKMNSSLFSVALLLFVAARSLLFAL